MSRRPGERPDACSGLIEDCEVLILGADLCRSERAIGRAAKRERVGAAADRDDAAGDCRAALNCQAVDAARENDRIALRDAIAGEPTRNSTVVGDREAGPDNGGATSTTKARYTVFPPLAPIAPPLPPLPPRITPPELLVSEVPVAAK